MMYVCTQCVVVSHLLQNWVEVFTKWTDRFLSWSTHIELCVVESPAMSTWKFILVSCLSAVVSHLLHNSAEVLAKCADGFLPWRYLYKCQGFDQKYWQLLPWSMHVEASVCLGFDQLCRWISSMKHTCWCVCMSRFRPKVWTVTSMKHPYWMSYMYDEVSLCRGFDQLFRWKFLHEAHMLRGLFEYLGFDQMCGRISSIKHPYWLSYMYMYVVYDEVSVCWGFHQMSRQISSMKHTCWCMCMSRFRPKVWTVTSTTHPYWMSYMYVVVLNQSTNSSQWHSFSVEADVLTKSTDC